MSDEEEEYVEEQAADDDEDQEQEQGSDEGEVGDAVEEEAEDADEDGDVDSSEEESGGQDEYEVDGFIVNEEEGDEEGEGPGSDAEQEKKKKKKKKKRKASEFIPDEDDINLLREAGVDVPQHNRRQHRRLKQRIEDEDEEAGGTENLEQRLFGRASQGLEDEMEEDGAAGGEEELGEEEDAYQYDEPGDEMDDFLDDGEEGGKRGARRRQAVPAFLQGLDPEALEDANEMLDYTQLEFFHMMNEHPQHPMPTMDDEGADGGEEEEENPPSDADDEVKFEFERRKEEREKQRKMKRLLATVDPETVAAHFLSVDDQRIVREDVPERMQLLGKLMEEKISCKEAATWVYNRIFSRDAPRRLEKDLVEAGLLEVEGPQPSTETHSGRCVGVRDGEAVHRLLGRRLVRDVRTSHEIEKWRDNAQCQEALQTSISDMLIRFNERMEEVPYVACYKKDECGELLALRREDMPMVTTESNEYFVPGTVQAKHRRIRRWDVLWCVYEWGVKFRQLAKRKAARAASYQASLTAMRETNASREMTLEDLEAAQQMETTLEGCISALADASTTEDLDDIDAKYRLVMDSLPGAERELLELSLSDKPATTRRPQRTTKYSMQRSLGLGKLVAAMTMSAEQLADNIESLFKKNEVPQLRQAVEVEAGRYVDPDHGLDTWEQVLKAAKGMAAQELAAEPAVRRFVRNLFYQKARLTTAPTPAGEAALEPAHRFGPVKRLQGKELYTLEGSDTFLRIHMAEKAGLITCKIEVPPSDVQSNILVELHELYLGEDVSLIGTAWNRHREEILQAAVLDLLLPNLEREFRVRALADAREVALKQAGDRFWELASRLPLHLFNSEEEAFIEFPKVMAVCWGDGTPGTMAVMLDDHGNLKDFLPLPQLSGNIPRGRQIGDERFEDPRKSRDLKRLKEFVMKHEPYEIIVGCSAPACKQLHDELVAVIDHLKDHEAEFIASHPIKHIGVRQADEAVAKLWENCASAKDELGEHPGQVRRAVGLGRSQLDPLAVLGALCSSRREVLSLHLHELQSALPAEELYAMVQQVMVTAVNQVGADVNAMAAFSWKAPALQFVCGLGPRKAAAMLKQIIGRDNSFLENRDVLFKTIFGKNNKKVFRNCAAFIRVRNPQLTSLSNAEEFRKLDNSRIHPEQYSKLALILANEILNLQEENQDHYEATRQIMGEAAVASNVEAMDLHKLAVDYNCLPRMAQLLDVQMEFLMPYGEIREVVPELNARQTFMLMYNETPESLRPGRLVEARVRFVNAEEVRCQLTGSGADAIIYREHFSSSRDVKTIRLGDCVKPDQVVQARLLDLVEVPQGRDGPPMVAVSLTTKSTDLADADRTWERKYCADHEPAYHIQTDSERREVDEAVRKAKPKASFIQRSIRHPLFENISGTDAASRLEKRPVGSCLFRPSSRGIALLSLSIKIHENETLGPTYVHFELREAKKGAGPAGLKLGLPITIEIVGKGPTQYDDLDEVLARFVEPYMANVRSITSHQKFLEGVRAIQDQALLRELQRQGPNQGVYHLVLDESKPGNFAIAFATSSKVHREYFVPTPDGIYFRKKVYSSVDRMLSEFKRNPTGGRAEAPRPSGAYPPRSSAGWTQPGYPPQQAPYTYGAHPYAAQPAYGGYGSGYGGHAPAAYAPAGGYAAYPAR